MNRHIGMEEKRLVVGILAHVDAGKTTLAEAILYVSGKLRTLGRVDHRDAFLDNFAMERERGITIFSKQARVRFHDMEFTLLDTPGHVDFAAETERTLQVLDYAVLVVSAADGVQGHTKTLWKLLERFEIPTFIFVNKTDQPGVNEERVLEQLRDKLSDGCVRFCSPPDRGMLESAALCEEALMEEYLENETISAQHLAEAVLERKIIPCYFGAALYLKGVEDLLEGLTRYTMSPFYGEDFGARVYKIGADKSGKRLTYLKVTGGVLRTKMPVNNASSAAPDEAWEEKADRLFLCDGAGILPVEEVRAGDVCAVAGFTRTFAGQGLGFESENRKAALEPVLTYRVILHEEVDAPTGLAAMRRLEEEDPQLQVVWKESLGEIHVKVMGDVQIEILERLLAERFGIAAKFGEGSIVYKETLAEPVEGIGHFEPLRHYAEVHLLLEPAEPGSGIQVASLCSEDVLALNWQRLIMTHLEEKTHCGVLTGSEVTDLRILLLSGRAHVKHTEGGDFRQATYRAVRQGLRSARNVLLEPFYSYLLEVPSESVGRAMTDIANMCGSFEIVGSDEESTTLAGKVPAATMQGYQRILASYTGGRGRLTCSFAGYEPCHNPEEVIAARGYDADSDTENPASSVFCAHGAGFVVEWDRVPEYAHLECGKFDVGSKTDQKDLSCPDAPQGIRVPGRESSEPGVITQEEIDAIFARTYGRRKTEEERFRRFHKKPPQPQSVTAAGNADRPARIVNAQEEYFLVDGYNIIFAWEELRELAAVNMDSARDRLIDILCNFQGYVGATLILVYDAYKVKGNPGSVNKFHNIYVVYTREAETADQYIEKTVHVIGRKYKVTVATSDALEQMIIWGEGAMRMSAAGLKEAVEQAGSRIGEFAADKGSLKNRLILPGEVSE